VGRGVGRPKPYKNTEKLYAGQGVTAAFDVGGWSIRLHRNLAASYANQAQVIGRRAKAENRGPRQADDRPVIRGAGAEFPAEFPAADESPKSRLAEHDLQADGYRKSSRAVQCLTCETSAPVLGHDICPTNRGPRAACGEPSEAVAFIGGWRISTTFGEFPPRRGDTPFGALGAPAFSYLMVVPSHRNTTNG
jgi:hypothetical protein